MPPSKIFPPNSKIHRRREFSKKGPKKMRGRSSRRLELSILLPPPAMNIGNCTVDVKGSEFTCPHQTSDCLLISTMGPAQIRVSPDEKSSMEKDFNFVILNPSDMNDYSTFLAQEVLNMYTKELPNMSYAANTGKRSKFLEKCVYGGKYKTLVMTSDSSKERGEVIAAISFQIIASDALYSEIPLASVSSKFQRKGLGQFLYSVLRKRLESVGVLNILCWADDESKGFWVKQGFTSIGDVDRKGRARRLPVRANVRKALCFPGGSTLMISNLSKNVVQQDLAPCTNIVVAESDEEYAEKKSIYFPSIGEKRCLWEASLTSLNSKRIRSSCPSECGTSDWSSASEYDFRVTPGQKTFPDALCNDGQAVEIQTKECGDFVKNDHKIFFMNILDESKKEWLSKIVEELGGCVASDGQSCTHVITGKTLRTLNFCTALCSGAWIVSSNWLKQSYREKRFIEESGFVLEDEEYASKYKSTLKDAVMKARENPRSLLKGYHVYVGKHVQPSSKILSSIIGSAGGLVISKITRDVESSMTIFIASEEDMEDAMVAAKMGIWTFSSDWLMNCIMRQELDFEAPQFLEPL